MERSYNLFKNQDVVGMTKEHFRLRNLVNVTLLSIAGWVAVNLHLRWLDRRDAEKLRRRGPHRPRSRPPTSIEVLPAPNLPFQPGPLVLTT